MRKIGLICVSLATFLGVMFLALDPRGGGGQPLAPPAPASPAPYTEVTSDITADTTWTLGGSPYLVSGSQSVAEGVTLTIEPGVVVKLNGHLRFYGSLVARGTPQVKIYFTSQRDDTLGGDTNGDGTATQPAPGDWGRLWLIDDASSGETTAALENVIIKYGDGLHASGLGRKRNLTLTSSEVSKSKGSGVNLTENVSATIQSTVIRDNAYNGFGGGSPVGADFTRLALLDSTITGNGQLAANIYSRGTGSIVIGNNYVAGNGWDVIGVNGTVGPGSSLSANSVPYASQTDLVVKAGATLTMTEGAELRLGYYKTEARLEVRGNLRVQGTAERPVVFSRATPAGQPPKDYWGGILVSAGGSLAMDYGRVEYAVTGVELAGAQSAAISHTSVLSSSQAFTGTVAAGLSILDTAANLSYNTILNSGTGISLTVSHAGLLPTVRDNSIIGNAQAGVAGTVPAGATLDLASNWWGDASGPTHPDNPGGKGDRIAVGGGAVNFRPWLASPPAQAPAPPQAAPTPWPTPTPTATPGPTPTLTPTPTATPIPAPVVTGVEPQEVIARVHQTQTLQLLGSYFNAAAAQVWLEQGGRRLDPVRVQVQSPTRILAEVNFTGVSGPWDVVVSQGSSASRGRVYVFPYLPIISISYGNFFRFTPGVTQYHWITLSNEGTAPGVALVGIIVPSGIEALTGAWPGYLGEVTPRTHLLAVSVAPGEHGPAGLFYRLPWSLVEPQPQDPSKVALGENLRFPFSLLGQPIPEGWSVIRQDAADLEGVVVGAQSASALLGGWALDQYQSLSQAAAYDYIERLGARYPFVADALVMGQLSELQLALIDKTGFSEGDLQYEGPTLPAQAAPEGRLALGSADWIERQIGDPWVFGKQFLTGLYDPSSSPVTTGEAGVFLLAEGEGLIQGLTFGLWRPNLGAQTQAHIFGMDPGLVQTGKVMGNLLSIPAGSFTTATGRVAKAAFGTAVKKLATRLKPGGDKYFLWDKLKLTVAGNANEPTRLGFDSVWKGGERNIVHWGEHVDFGTHWAYGWSRNPVVINGVVQTSSKGNILYGAGPHIYQNKAYIPWWNVGELRRPVLNTKPIWQGAITAAHVNNITQNWAFPGTDGSLCDQGNTEVTAAWDPNEIEAHPTAGYIPLDQSLQVTVRFENLKTANLPATNVAISMTVDSNLDWDSLVQEGASHPSLLSVEADRAGRNLTWRFTAINLPPNQNPPEGEGWVRFRVRPRPDLTAGGQIRLKAQIVFDENPPIATNEVRYTVDTTAPESTLSNLEASRSGAAVFAQAQDDLGGSGVSSLSLLYSLDGAFWSQAGVLTATVPSAVLSGTLTFKGEGGRRYWLTTTAADALGNTEPITITRAVTVDLPAILHLPLVTRSFPGGW